MTYLNWYTEHWQLGTIIMLFISVTVSSCFTAAFGRRVYRVEVVRKDQ